MARHTTPTLLAALVVCGAGASLTRAAAPLAAAPGARVVTVSPVGTTASEPAIAVNPHEPHQIVAVGGRWAAYSIDAGATFTPVRLTPDDHPPLGDVSLAFDDRGRLFLSYLAIRKTAFPATGVTVPAGTASGCCARPTPARLGIPLRLASRYGRATSRT